MKKIQTILGSAIQKTIDVDIFNVNQLLKYNKVDAEIYTKDQFKSSVGYRLHLRNDTGKPFEIVLGEILNIVIKDMYWSDNGRMRIIFE